MSRSADQIICPHCSAINRVPPQRRTDHPRCGKCKQALFTGHPLTLTDQTFSRHLQKSGLPVLVDFWAPWCGPCKMMAPAFEQAAAALEPQIQLAKFNTEENPMVAGQLGIRSIPTLALFRDGQEIARQAGAMGASDILRWAQQYL